MSRFHAKAGRWLPRTLVGGILAGALVLGSGAVAAADQVYWVPVTRTLTVSGHGFGHGHGLSQYGAEAAALRGRSARQILAFYYPGTSMAAARGWVRVLISGGTSAVEVSPQPGLRVRDLNTRATSALPARRRIERWRIRAGRSSASLVQFRASGRWHRWRVLSGDGEFLAPGPITLDVPTGGGGEVAHRYRGMLRAASPYPGARTRATVDVVRLDDYVRGVVPYEMPTSWAPQALRAQAVAVRTYAVWQRAENRHRYYQICDTTACQVYGGAAAEQPSSNAAVAATAGRILRYGGRPALTQFSASDGGWTAAGGLPYLPAKHDPYDRWSGNPYHRWRRHIDVSGLNSAHPRLGGLKAIRVAQRSGQGRWGGRVERLVLIGRRHKAVMSGDLFRSIFGLPSEWFSIAPTPIIRRWDRLGGASSPLGRIASGEFHIAGGSVQVFGHGRMYWSARTGARDLRGPILHRYRQLGASASRLGFPVTGVLPAPGHGHKASFRRGIIASSRDLGPHVLYGPIRAKYASIGQLRSRLGYPTTDVFRITGGTRARFQHGRITWHRRSNRTVVHYR
jgi:stage II sporulation protein D